MPGNVNVKIAKLKDNIMYIKIWCILDFSRGGQGKIVFPFVFTMEIKGKRNITVRRWKRKIFYHK